MCFSRVIDILEKCGKIGEVSIDSAVTNTTTPNSCIVSSTADKATLQANSSQCKPLVKLTSSTVAIVGRPRSIDIKMSNISWLDRFRLSCHLVADVGGVFTQCEIKHVEKEKCRISFTATHQGLHHVKVQVKEKEIPCDPCSIQVIPTINATCIRHPIAIATTSSGLLAVATSASIVVVDKESRVISRSDAQGGGCNTGMCIIPDSYILVVSSDPPHITKYAMDCTLVSTANTSYGSGQLQFNLPQGIAVSTSGHVYVCDTGNHRIQVLNPDLTFSRMLGKEGSRPGRFIRPRGIAIDSQDTIYVCDNGNHRIQKLPSNGTYISEFRVPSRPRYIAIDYNILYVTTRGHYSSVYY